MNDYGRYNGKTIVNMKYLSLRIINEPCIIMLFYWNRN